MPTGWPDEVSPPGTPDWEASAVAWLLDLVPEYRQHATVRRQPVVLAFIARHVIDGATEGARLGYLTTRRELGELAPPHAVDALGRQIMSPPLVRLGCRTRLSVVVNRKSADR